MDNRSIACIIFYMMRSHTNFIKSILVIAGLLAILFCLMSCSNTSSGSQTPSPLPTNTGPAPTSTPSQPTSTPIPLAAQVNQEDISLAEYQAELSRYQTAIGTELATEQQNQVLNDIIDQYLLAQEAHQAGYQENEATTQERIDGLISELGSEEAFNEWMATNGYTMETFRKDLARSIAADWMRDQVISQVLQTAEQVHIRQILLYNSDQAEEVLAQLKVGSEFSSLAAQYDPVTYGDLGWFPRGYLLDEQVEDAAFSLEIGEFSEVIESPAGFHILQLIERDAQHPLEPGALFALQVKALEKWLQERRSESQIEILVPLAASGSKNYGSI